MFKRSFKALLGAIDGKEQFQFRWKNNQLRFLSTLVLRASHSLRSLCLNDGASFSTLNVYILIMSSSVSAFTICLICSQSLSLLSFFLVFIAKVSYVLFKNVMKVYKPELNFHERCFILFWLLTKWIITLISYLLLCGVSWVSERVLGPDWIWRVYFYTLLRKLSIQMEVPQHWVLFKAN